MEVRPPAPARLALAVATVALAAACGGPPAASAGPPGSAAAPGAGVTSFPAGTRHAPGPVVGDLLDGTHFDLATLSGRVVVVNFWGSWCAPCRAEAADLLATFHTTSALGVVFVGVDVRDTRDAATAFVADHHIDYPSLFDPAGRVALAFAAVNPNVVPTTVILDRAGRVATVYRQRITADQLSTAVRALAAQTHP